MNGLRVYRQQDSPYILRIVGPRASGKTTAVATWMQNQVEATPSVKGLLILPTEQDCSRFANQFTVANPNWCITYETPSTCLRSVNDTRIRLASSYLLSLLRGEKFDFVAVDQYESCTPPLDGLHQFITSVSNWSSSEPPEVLIASVTPV